MTRTEETYAVEHAPQSLELLLNSSLLGNEVHEGRFLLRGSICSAVNRCRPRRYYCGAVYIIHRKSHSCNASEIVVR